VRILYFHQYFSTPQGAAGIRSFEMARRLVSRGHQVLVVCGSAERGQTGLESAFVNGRRRGFIDGGIEVLEYDLGYSNRDGFAKRTLAFLRFAWRSVLVALTEHCDLVFATTTPLTAGIPGIAARWLRRRRFIFEVRDLWPELPKAMGVIRNPIVLWLMSMLEWASYHSADRLIGLSPGIVDGIARRGIVRSRIAMIPNGCDLTIFDGSATSWRPAAIAPNDLMAVFAGAHGEANGLDAVLDAAGVLKRRGVERVQLLLIGEGKCKAALQERAARELLTNVHFLSAVPKLRLAGLMAATDIGLQVLANVPAFYFGTSPNKFFDYIAAGLPVLINYPGWLAELVTEHHCGFSVPPDDSEAFAQALVYAADNREKLPVMRRNASTLARTKFDRNTLGAAFVDWLEISA
jgi:glycosyltransferase involved in cell wall biosynthesis